MWEVLALGVTSDHSGEYCGGSRGQIRRIWWERVTTTMGNILNRSEGHGGWTGKSPLRVLVKQIGKADLFQRSHCSPGGWDLLREDGHGSCCQLLLQAIQSLG
jgi:hypothetical protein